MDRWWHVLYQLLAFVGAIGALIAYVVLIAVVAMRG